MPKSLAEYAEWLAERNLRWPAPPKREPVNAQPYLKPLPGIKAVAWDVYGTLLRITDGELLFQHPQAVRMEVALDKTLQEFAIWHAMSCKPGPPWEYLQSMYLRAYDDLRLAGSGRKGDLTEIDSAKLWRKILGKLNLEEFRYDVAVYGDLDQLAEKMAYFFHASLQGTEAADGALTTLHSLENAGIISGLVADGQCFTEVQMLRGLRAQGTLPPAGGLWSPDVVVLSARAGVRKPSKSLYLQAIQRFASLGCEPSQVLYVGARLREDLTVAKSLGFRTALFAGDKTSLRATLSDLRDPAVKPDRMLTEVPQVLEILSL